MLLIQAQPIASVSMLYQEVCAAAVAVAYLTFWVAMPGSGHHRSIHQFTHGLGTSTTITLVLPEVTMKRHTVYPAAAFRIEITFFNNYVEKVNLSNVIVLLYQSKE